MTTLCPVAERAKAGKRDILLCGMLNLPGASLRPSPAHHEQRPPCATRIRLLGNRTFG